MSSTRRMRGQAIHRALLIGSTATPLSPAERLTAPPDHTHRWTVAVRSAASHPLPTLPPATTGMPAAPGSSAAASTSATAAAGAQEEEGISTRGRDHSDFHRCAGGKDDISHFIKRVQFKLHDTYAHATRNIDRAPFQVTETGWGEFEIAIKIFFVAESGEKPLQTHHHLKLHPWHPVSRPVVAPPPAPAATAETAPQEGAPAGEASASADVSMASVEEKADDAQQQQPAESSQTAATQESEAQSKLVDPPPVVHSWAYEEIVFPEPLEPFYDILIAHPPTPLFSSSAQAFADPSAYRSYLSLLSALPASESAGVGTAPDAHQLGSAAAASGTLLPPHALHASTGALFDALSLEAVAHEADRLDAARTMAVRELEACRAKLIESEKKLREGKKRLESGMA